jgi:hypothetical protein
MIMGILGVLLLLAALFGYRYASKLNKENTSKLKKEQKAAIKQKSNRTRWIAHSTLTVALLLVIIGLFQQFGGKYDLNTLNYNVPIQVTTDKDYGREHTDMPVNYEMKIPTSGPHSPHDLKFGYYTDKPKNEMLVHNLEHGDIIIYYRPDASQEIKDAVKRLSHFTKAGSGVLAVPNDVIPEGKEIVVTAWDKTMELTTYDEKQIGTFIYEYIDHGPEKIPSNIRRGGGTM